MRVNIFGARSDAMTGEFDLLEILTEPAFVLAPDSRVIHANRAARRILGVDPRERSLCEFAGSSTTSLLPFLARCSGTSSQLIGATVLKTADGSERKFRAYGSRLPDREQKVRIALRCIATATDGFSVLARQVRDLNKEVMLRTRAQAHLEESLRHNEILLRELHHRVKNNIQMIHGLFAAAQRETSSDEIRSFLDTAINRLVSIGTAQQILYEAQELESVSTQVFIRALCDALGVTFGASFELDCKVSDGRLSSETALPLALIVNELLTNAMKYGKSGGVARVEVSLDDSDGEWLLVVRDHGPGMPEQVSERRASGLGLVRGLCRQIGGAMAIESRSGTIVSVRFRNPA
ncbi:MAG TPA: histidine kinase dimerization/phosphoacceptor domain -containing protein, partial [Saliniramus sp.]|nr:histidine kinase dimerization/phosphoacceptor domain -containing protein [Saliniramus sp.]